MYHNYRRCLVREFSNFSNNETKLQTSSSSNIMSKRQAPTSGSISLDSVPPFLPLEETMRSRTGTETSVEIENGENGDTTTTQSMGKNTVSKTNPTNIWLSRIKPKINPKKIILTVIGGIFSIIIWESFFVEPENRLIQPDFSDKFLAWVETNPGWGLGAIVLVIAAAVVSMVPIGTPLTLGCGYIYHGVYGWRLGLFVSTVVSMAGSTLGAVICFLLGRYLMRDTVKKWVRNYPLFDAIDVGKFPITSFGPYYVLLSFPCCCCCCCCWFLKGLLWCLSCLNFSCNSCFRTRFKNHGDAILNTCSTAWFGKLHVRYNYYGCVLVCSCENRITTSLFDLYLHGSFRSLLH